MHIVWIVVDIDSKCLQLIWVNLEWSILSPKYRASWMMIMKLSPVLGLLHAVATVAIGTSLMGVNSSWKP